MKQETGINNNATIQNTNERMYLARETYANNFVIYIVIK